MWIRQFVAAALLAATACGPAFGGEKIEAQVDELLRASAFRDGQWGMLVVDGKTGGVVFERNPETMFSPASVTKLFSTAAALAELGADHRFRTPVVRKGDVDDQGALKGDLILVAQGDLTMGGRAGPDETLLFKNDDHTYANGNLDAQLVDADPLAGLDEIARQVRQSGITRITGKVLIDDRLFEQASGSGSGPKILSPIVVNDNVVDLLITPASESGEPAGVRVIPESSYVAADIRIETAPKDEKPYLLIHAIDHRRFTVRGKIPIGFRPVVKVLEIDRPSSFARALLIDRLRSKGIVVDASPLDENDPAELPSREEVAKLAEVAHHTSAPLSENVKLILKVSHNLHASTLPLLLAAHRGKTKYQDAMRIEGERLGSMIPDLKGVSFGGGAGGERADLVSPRATVTLLRSMAERADFPSYRQALPVLGEDGTLAKAVGPESKARGRVRAKTGTYLVENDLTGRGLLTSKALAGYMETASGRPLVFAFFVNNVPLDAPVDSLTTASSAAGKLLGKLCEIFHDDEGDREPAASR